MTVFWDFSDNKCCEVELFVLGNPELSLRPVSYWSTFVDWSRSSFAVQHCGNIYHLNRDKYVRILSKYLNKQEERVKEVFLSLLQTHSSPPSLDELSLQIQQTCTSISFAEGTSFEKSISPTSVESIEGEEKSNDEVSFEDLRLFFLKKINGQQFPPEKS